MSNEDFDRLFQAQKEDRKVRAKLKNGTWSEPGYVEAGIGEGVPQIGVRLGIYDKTGNKIEDFLLIFNETELVEFSDNEEDH